MSVNRNATHGFSKLPRLSILLVAGLGVDGDAHMGAKVKHRYDMARDPTKPNLRQVHLIQAELFEELAEAGFSVAPGDLGENITTRGINLLALSPGTLLALGSDAVVEITGLREPCVLIDRFQNGLMKACLGRDADGSLIRKTGVMAVVRSSGEVGVGDSIRVMLPEKPHRRLECI